MSVPVPIAIPTSACARAGASLIPSPTIATCLPCRCSFFTMSAFCEGSTSARISSKADIVKKLQRQGKQVAMELLHDVGLLRGQHFGQDLVDPDLVRHRLRGPFRVPR